MTYSDEQWRKTEAIACYLFVEILPLIHYDNNIDGYLQWGLVICPSLVDWFTGSCN